MMIYILILVSLLISQDNTNEDLDVHFDLYNQIFEKFTTNYVDSLDKTKLILAFIIFELQASIIACKLLPFPDINIIMFFI